MRHLLLSFCFLFAFGSAAAQIDTLNHLRFEASSNPWGFSTSPSSYSVGNDIWADVTSVGDAPNAITANTGTDFWAIRDLDNTNGGSPNYHFINMTVIDISSYATEDVKVEINFATFEFDEAFGDTLGYQIEYNASGPFNGPVNVLSPNTNATWEKEIIDVPMGASHVRLRLMAKQNGEPDWAGFDDIILTKQPSNPPPVLDIATVTTNDATGVADSLGVSCELRGSVHGVDLQAGTDDIEFTLIDPTGGIGVLSIGDAYGYAVNEGDSVHIIGDIIQTDGLTQIQPTSISLVGNGTIYDAQAITALDESTESEMVRLDSVSLVTPGNWGGGNNALDVTDGTNTYTVFIDDNVDLAGFATIPGFAMNITGIGSQSDASSPFDSGYRIVPRYSADIEFILPVSVKSAECQSVVLEVPYSGAGITWNNIAASTADTAEYTATGAVSLSVDNSFGATNSFGNATATADTTVDVGNDLTGIASFALPADTVCQDTLETYSFDGGLLAVPVDFSWDFDGQGTATGSSADFAFTATGDYEVQLILTDTSGLCTDTTTDSVHVEDCAPVVIPSLDIATVTTNDSNGQPDSLGVTCQLTGTVYGIDQETGANDLQFTLIDNTGGIAVRSIGNTFGYTVFEGDVVTVTGTIGELNGLTVIDNLTDLQNTATNLTTPAATVTALDESTESEFVKLENVRFVDTANWQTTAPFDMDVTDGTNTFTVTITDAVDLNGLALSFDYPFTVNGIGTQNDPTLPATDGYALVPQSSGAFDFDLPITIKNEGCGDLTLEIPVNTTNTNWSTGSTADTTLVTTTGLVDVDVPDFGSAVGFGDAAAAGDTLIASVPSGVSYDSFIGFPNDTICLDTSYTLSFDNSNATSYTWDPDEGGMPVMGTDPDFTYAYFTAGTYTFTATATEGNCTATETQTVVVEQCTTQVGRPDLLADLRVFPNPASDRVFVETAEQLNRIALYDLQGRALQHIRVEQTAGGYTLDLPTIAKGLYVLQVVAANGQRGSIKLLVD